MAKSYTKRNFNQGTTPAINETNLDAMDDGINDAIDQANTNETDIATNVADIATNVADISTNASDISTNASDISTNASDISTNASNISTNAVNLAFQQRNNRMFDPNFLHLVPETDFGGRTRWLNGSNLAQIAGGGLLLTAAVNSSGGYRVYLDELGFEVGDTIAASCYADSADGEARMQIRFKTSGDSVISTDTGADIAMTGSPVLVSNSATIPATTESVELYVQRRTTSSTITITDFFISDSFGLSTAEYDYALDPAVAYLKAYVDAQIASEIASVGMETVLVDRQSVQIRVTATGTHVTVDPADLVGASYVVVEVENDATTAHDELLRVILRRNELSSQDEIYDENDVIPSTAKKGYKFTPFGTAGTEGDMTIVPLSSLFSPDTGKGFSVTLASPNGTPTVGTTYVTIKKG